MRLLSVAHSASRPGSLASSLDTHSSDPTQSTASSARWVPSEMPGTISLESPCIALGAIRCRPNTERRRSHQGQSHQGHNEEGKKRICELEQMTRDRQ